MPRCSTRPSAVTVYYDAGCGFCVWSVALLLRLDRSGRVSPAAIQDHLDRDLASVPAERVMESFHARAAGAAPVSAGAALTVVLSTIGLSRPIGLVSATMPGVTDRMYVWVADRRGRWAKLIPESSKQRARGYVTARTGS